MVTFGNVSTGAKVWCTATEHLQLIDICTDLINNSYTDNNISSSISEIAKVCSQFGR